MAWSSTQCGTVDSLAQNMVVLGREVVVQRPEGREESERDGLEKLGRGQGRSSEGGEKQPAQAHTRSHSVQPALVVQRTAIFSECTGHRGYTARVSAALPGVWAQGPAPLQPHVRRARGACSD